MVTTAFAIAVGAIVLGASLSANLPLSRLAMSPRLVLVGIVLIAIAITMTASAALVLDAGPLQIWGLGGPETL